MKIVDEFRRRFGSEDYPGIIIYSANFGEFTRLISEGRNSEAANILINAANSLESAGADFIVIAANTPHMFLDYIVPQIKIPVLSIIDALTDKLKRDSIDKVGSLGTKFTLTMHFYVEGLRKHGLSVILPEMDDINTINEIIYGELVKGVVREDSKYRVIEVIRRLIGRGVKGIVLACTVFPLLVSGEVNGVKLYDTAKIHALKALEYAIKEWSIQIT